MRDCASRGLEMPVRRRHLLRVAWKEQGDFMADRAHGLSRRKLIAAAAGVTSAVALGSMPQAQALEKMTQRQAQYQDSPKDIMMCATCTLFEPPKSCKVVEGDVSPSGWCKAFALAD
jgi:hypothetical protein